MMMYPANANTIIAKAPIIEFLLLLNFCYNQAF